jgi:hypothetical protein
LIEASLLSHLENKADETDKKSPDWQLPVGALLPRGLIDVVGEQALLNN